MRAKTKATERMEFRATREEKRLIEQAARARGQTVTEFAVRQLVRKARRVLDQDEATRLSTRDRDVFLNMLAAEAEPNAALRAAFEEHA
jgi:uncharacterized protein (DUF1778 family)